MKDEPPFIAGEMTASEMTARLVNSLNNLSSLVKRYVLFVKLTAKRSQQDG